MTEKTNEERAREACYGKRVDRAEDLIARVTALLDAKDAERDEARRLFNAEYESTGPLKADNARLREEIEKAPCPDANHRHWPIEAPASYRGGCVHAECDCWKRAALNPEWSDG